MSKVHLKLNLKYDKLQYLKKKNFNVVLQLKILKSNFRKRHVNTFYKLKIIIIN